MHDTSNDNGLTDLSKNKLNAVSWPHLPPFSSSGRKQKLKIDRKWWNNNPRYESHDRDLFSSSLTTLVFRWQKKTWKTSVQRVPVINLFLFLIFSFSPVVASWFARALQYHSLPCKSMLDCGDFLEKPTIRWKRGHENRRWQAPKERLICVHVKSKLWDFLCRSFQDISC